jgi:hypothetical protein
MKTFLLTSFFLLLMFSAYLSAQIRRDPDPIDTSVEGRLMDMTTLETRMKNVGKNDKAAEAAPVEPELSSEAKARVLAARRIRVADIQNYAAFLQQKNTGVIKLFPDRECQTHTLVRITAECSLFVPKSSDISFRDIGYVARDYRDLGFEGSELVSTGFFTQGILMGLGDVSIETIDLKSAGIMALAGFSTAKNYTDARETSKQLKTGRDSEGARLSSRIPVKLGETYGLRVIAYRVGNSLQPPKKGSSLLELKFLSLGVDTRADIIIVFRVAAVDDLGGLTIVWHELQRKDAPAIKFGKGETMQDFAIG